ncbi:uncharacterized protein LOC141614628 [Silene latifolia]|uniref:uncharacterized protein LOC141614628 n=1 Tax=Silene latifolia TaxID=37657 RepID=UPI003D772094
MASWSTEDILRDKNITDPSSITTLSLTHKPLSNVSPLRPFINLERLDLSFNNLSSLQGLEVCVKLKWLSVQQNKLDSLKGIESLTNLTVCNAGKNKIRSMDEVKNLVKLCALILNDNEISSISGLDQLSELNTLVLSRNPISKMGNAFAKLKSIVKISLSNCQLEAIDTSIKACTELEQLRLSHNDITTLPEELSHNKKLQILDIGNNMLSRWSDIEALSSLRNLKNLNVLGNPIAEKAKLLKKINKLAPSLQILNSKRIETLKDAQKNKKVEHERNDVEPLKKKKDIGERLMENTKAHNLPEEKGDSLKKQKYSKDHAANEGANMELNEENQINKGKKKKNQVEKEVPVQETDKTKTEKKAKRNAEKAGIDDVIDDKERSFMELLDYNTPENMNADDGKRKNRSVENVNSTGAVVTFPAKNKKAKGAGLSAFEFIDPAPDVGLGGPSAWDV